MPGIPAQQKLYLADQRHYVAGLEKVPFPLELETAIGNWRPEMEEDVGSGSDYESSHLVSESDVDVVPHRTHRRLL